MAKLFFLLSGEHETLPVSELKAILETEACTYQISEKLDQAARLEAATSCVEAVKCRAAFTRLCAQELFTCNADTNSITKAMQSASLDQVLKPNETFAVRVKHVKSYSSRLNGMTFEKRIGGIIAGKGIRTKVDLKMPNKVFVGVLTSGRFIFGLKLAEIPAKPFVERRPRKKPFFHPSAMQAKLARCMINLAHPKPGDLVLDPFCGTGTMLVEAALIGCQVLGLDIQRRMARGTVRNLEHFAIKPEGVIIADARNMPIVKVDCLVTDPPYGTSSTTLKRTTKQIIEEVLKDVCSLLEKGKRICMAAPRKIDIAKVGTALGYKHLESNFVYVHRSLTREIAVFEKV